MCNFEKWESHPRLNVSNKQSVWNSYYEPAWSASSVDTPDDRLAHFYSIVVQYFADVVNVYIYLYHIVKLKYI